MLAPAAPHITEELWSRLAEARGEAWSSIHAQSWPTVDDTVIVEATYEVPIQVNGKLRDKVTVPADATSADIEAAVLGRERIQTILAELGVVAWDRKPTPNPIPRSPDAGEILKARTVLVAVSPQRIVKVFSFSERASLSFRDRKCRPDDRLHR